MAKPWTVVAMEREFDSLGRHVSQKSIENWRSGASRPSRQNIHVVSRLFSGGDRMLQRRWLDALITARAASEAVTKDDTMDDVALVAVEAGETPAGSPRRRARVAGLALAAVTGLIGLGYAAGSSEDVLENDTARVTDIRFCLPDEFDAASLRCTVARDRFAAGTTKILVSFESEGVAPGQAFERRWYRGGEMFLSRDGFFDEVWENWTYLENPDGHDPGRYHMRVIVDGTVATGGFEMGG